MEFTTEEEHKGFSKIQQDHRIRSRMYERMLNEQEQFWKAELAEKEEQLHQMQMEREEWRNRETFWLSEMEALAQRGTQGTAWVTQTFAKAYRRLEEGMISLENMKLAPGDENKDRRRRTKERKDRMESRASFRQTAEREEEEEESDEPHASGRATALADQQTWDLQTEQMEGKWDQVKRILEMTRQDMERRSMMGSTGLRQDFEELYGRLAVCRRSMARVKRELDDKFRKKEFLWRRLGLRMQMGEQAAQEGSSSSSPQAPRHRHGRSRSRPNEKDEVEEGPTTRQ